MLTVLPKSKDEVWVLADAAEAQALIDDLELFHIREDFEMKILPEQSVLEFHGPRVPVVLKGLGFEQALEPFSFGALSSFPSALFVYDPWAGDVGGRFLVPSAELAPFTEKLRGLEADLVELDKDALEVMRIEGGHPKLGVDTSEKTLLQELGPLGETMVSHTKGCYLGQETVARVHARGQVNRQLVGLLVEGEAVPELGTLIVHDESAVGEVKSAVHSPSLRKVVGLAFLRSALAEPGRTVYLKMDGDLVAATVAELPLYRVPGPKEQSRKLYQDGLEAFKNDNFEGAIGLFEKSLLMDPNFGDAVEAMGVSQERLGRIDEAVETMQMLADVDPNNPMSWTNLSRYLAQQGKIEEAEEAKGKALYLSWKRDAGEAAAKKKQEEDNAQARAQMEERLELFQQVLEIDPDDTVANFGMGKLLSDLERYEDAVDPLRNAVRVQPDYSAAYNLLGTALMRADRTEEARAAFEKGVEVATKKGDLMPKRDMQQKLERLSS